MIFVDDSKRKVCVVVASRANYGRVKFLMKAIQEHPQLDLQLVVGASTLLERFGKAVNIIREDGFEPERTIHYVIEGETLTTQAKSTGLGIVELSTVLADLQPDLVVTVADRFETMATAIAATYSNIRLVHLQGGEVSGNIDDRVRHAITKLADYHFTATEESRNRVIQMGEAEDRVFNFGCPAMDILAHENMDIDSQIMMRYTGVGVNIDWKAPYVLMVQHPVTTSYGDGFIQVLESLEALKQFPDLQKIVLWPNIDAGSDDVSKGIRVFREKNMQESYHYYKNFSPEDYARVLANARCCIGNSSSFIRECAFLGTPSVIVGDRQAGREHGHNIVFADYDRKDIFNKINDQLSHGPYEHDKIFGKGDAGKRIANILSTIDIVSEKRNSY